MPHHMLVSFLSVLFSGHLFPSRPTNQLSHPSCHLDQQDLEVVHVTLTVPVPLQFLLPRVPSLVFLASRVLLQGLVHSILCEDSLLPLLLC